MLLNKRKTKPNRPSNNWALEEILAWREEKYFFFALVPRGFSALLSRVLLIYCRL